MRVIAWTINILAAGIVILCSTEAANGQTCTPSDPCFETLYVMPGGEEIHLKYGDTVQLKFDGNNTWLVPDAEEWNSAPVKLTPVTVRFKVGIETKLVPMWRFRMKSTKPDHIPADGEHSELLMYRNPLEGDVYIYNAKHTGGDVHGGTAHMHK